MTREEEVRKIIHKAVFAALAVHVRWFGDRLIDRLVEQNRIVDKAVKDVLTLEKSDENH